MNAKDLEHLLNNQSPTDQLVIDTLIARRETERKRRAEALEDAIGNRPEIIAEVSRFADWDGFDCIIRLPGKRPMRVRTYWGSASQVQRFAYAQVKGRFLWGEVFRSFADALVAASR